MGAGVTDSQVDGEPPMHTVAFRLMYKLSMNNKRIFSQFGATMPVSVQVCKCMYLHAYIKQASPIRTQGTQKLHCRKLVSSCPVSLHAISRNSTNLVDERSRVWGRWDALSDLHDSEPISILQNRGLWSEHLLGSF